MCESETDLPALVSEELASVFDDLLIRQQTVGLLLAQGEDLPQGHPKRPHVTGRGELPLEERTHTQDDINTHTHATSTLLLRPQV